MQQTFGGFAAGAIDARRPQEGRAPVGIAPPVSFGDAFDASRRDVVETRNSGVREVETLEALWARHRTAERAVGHRLPLSHSLAGQPTEQRDSLKDFLERIIPTDRINAAILGRPGTLTDDEYEQRLEALRTEHPEALSGIETRDQLAQRLQADWYAVRRRAQEQTGGVEGTTGSFVGGVVGSFQDPVTAGGAVLTGGFGAGRSLLMRMLTQGALSAGTEAMEAPRRAVEAERYGGPAYTAQEGAADILFAGVGAAGLEGVGAAIRAGARPIARAWRSGTTPAPESPENRAALNLLERWSRDDDLAGPATGDVVDETRAALDHFSPPPEVPVERDLSELPLAPGPSLTPLDYQGRQAWTGTFDPMAVSADPERFQYKASADGEGVTGRLAEVERWDATAAGRAVLYEDTAGERFIADGHQRRALARRLIETGQDTTASLDGFLFRQADGWSAEDVRVIAALKNIREGSGEPLDAAKVLRAAPGLIDDRSLPVTGAFMDGARGLARLNDEAFGAVVNDVLPARWGAVIGNMAWERPDLHGDLVALLRKANPRSTEEARALAHEALSADFVARNDDQADLFGGLPRESALIARGQLRAAVLRQLKTDARLFGQLVRNADAIETGGNMLARDSNAMRLGADTAAMGMIDRLSLRAGGIGDVFAEAAGAVGRGDLKLADASSRVLRAIREAVAETDNAMALRMETLAPRAPSLASREALAAFDEAGGSGQRAQLTPKPEDAEAEANAASLWPDLAEPIEERRAADLLRACAPGVA
jgi:hypothetical protein